MRALTYTRYTGPEGLTVRDVPTPEPSPDQVLVRVHAAGLNPFDWHLYRGLPWLVRGQEGLRVKGTRIPGADLAGVVESVGERVTGLRPGDKVLGSVGIGAMAEYVVAPEAALARIGDDADLVAAAALPMAGLTALQALRDAGGLTEGERVLVWGASGGVGHLAVQLALHLGAHRVSGVCSAANAEWVRTLGAREIYDYTSAAVAENASGYHVVVDTVATARASEIRRVLAKGGRWVIVGALGSGPLGGGKFAGPLGPTLRSLAAAGLQGIRATNALARVLPADLATLAALLSDGTLTPRIQQTYSLDDAAEAYRVLEAGHVAGKLVVRLD